MKKIIFCVSFAGVLSSCTWHPAPKAGSPAVAGQAADAASSAGGSGQQASGQASASAADKDASPLIDTDKLKADIGSVLSSIASGNPDTNKLRKAGSDVLNTSADMLSDSGIDKLYGNSNDPAVKQAAAMLKKYRDAMGITPASLDSIRKAAEQLKSH